MTAGPAAQPRELVAILRRGRDLPWLQLAAVVYVVTIAIVPGASGWRSIISILVLASFVVLASAGQTFAALLGGLDLSIPEVIGLANVFICELTGVYHWPFTVAAGLLLLIAAVVGAFNGFVSKRFAIHPLLVTIGTGAILTGLVRSARTWEERPPLLRHGCRLSRPQTRRPAWCSPTGRPAVAACRDPERFAPDEDGVRPTPLRNRSQPARGRSRAG